MYLNVVILALFLSADFDTFLGMTELDNFLSDPSTPLEVGQQGPESIIMRSKPLYFRLDVFCLLNARARELAVVYTSTVGVEVARQIHKTLGSKRQTTSSPKYDDDISC